jgi:hypothetical protein
MSDNLFEELEKFGSPVTETQARKEAQTDGGEPQHEAVDEQTQTSQQE